MAARVPAPLFPVESMAIDSDATASDSDESPPAPAPSTSRTQPALAAPAKTTTAIPATNILREHPPDADNLAYVKGIVTQQGQILGQLQAAKTDLDKVRIERDAAVRRAEAAKAAARDAAERAECSLCAATTLRADKLAAELEAVKAQPKQSAAKRKTAAEKDFEARLSKKDLDLTQERALRESIESQVQSSQTQIESLTQQLAAAAAQPRQDQQSSRLQSELADARKRIDAQERKIARLTEGKSSVAAQNQALQADLRREEERYRDLEHALEAARSDLDGQRLRMADMEAEMQAAVARADESASAARTAARALEDERRTAAEHAARASRESAALRNECDKLKAQATAIADIPAPALTSHPPPASSADDLLALRSQLGTKEKQLSDLIGLLTAAQMERNDLNGQIADLRAKLDEARAMALAVPPSAQPTSIASLLHSAPPLLSPTVPAPPPPPPLHTLTAPTPARSAPSPPPTTAAATTTMPMTGPAPAPTSKRPPKIAPARDATPAPRGAGQKTAAAATALPRRKARDTVASASPVRARSPVDDDSGEEPPAPRRSTRAQQQRRPNSTLVSEDDDDTPVPSQPKARPPPHARITRKRNRIPEDDGSDDNNHDGGNRGAVSSASERDAGYTNGGVSSADVSPAASPRSETFVGSTLRREVLSAGSDRAPAAEPKRRKVAVSPAVKTAQVYVQVLAPGITKRTSNIRSASIESPEPVKSVARRAISSAGSSLPTSPTASPPPPPPPRAPSPPREPTPPPEISTIQQLIALIGGDASALVAQHWESFIPLVCFNPDDFVRLMEQSLIRHGSGHVRSLPEAAGPARTFRLTLDGAGPIVALPASFPEHECPFALALALFAAHVPALVAAVLRRAKTSLLVFRLALVVPAVPQGALRAMLMDAAVREPSDFMDRIAHVLAFRPAAIPRGGSRGGSALEACLHAALVAALKRSSNSGAGSRQLSPAIVQWAGDQMHVAIDVPGHAVQHQLEVALREGQFGSAFEVARAIDMAAAPHFQARSVPALLSWVLELAEQHSDSAASDAWPVRAMLEAIDAILQRARVSWTPTPLDLKRLASLSLLGSCRRAVEGVLWHVRTNDGVLQCLAAQM
ncbi:hypothetical protein BC828DRAFT_383410 [Blastocladiella britannica]|nr:hypothetical protein BC828DRAFT_383410 [Blastocladiella britannica]